MTTGVPPSRLQNLVLLFDGGPESVTGDFPPLPPGPGRPDMRYFEDRLADELAGLAGRSADEATRMIQGLVSRFSGDDLRDDMTILVAKVEAPPETSG